MRWNYIYESAYVCYGFILKWHAILTKRDLLNQIQGCRFVYYQMIDDVITVNFGEYSRARVNIKEDWNCIKFTT